MSPLLGFTNPSCLSPHQQLLHHSGQDRSDQIPPCLILMTEEKKKRQIVPFCYNEKRSEHLISIDKIQHNMASQKEKILDGLIKMA